MKVIVKVIANRRVRRGRTEGIPAVDRAARSYQLVGQYREAL